VSGTQRQQTHPLAGAEDTLKDFWTTRPRRPRQGRKIAGVAAAIGNRYDIDPVIVRVALVVTAFFGGAGVLLYLAGWLLFPEQNDDEAPFMAMIRQGRSSTSTFFTLLLCAVTIGALIFTLSGDNGSGLLGLVVLIAGMYLLHRHRAALGRQPTRPAAPADSQPTVTLGTQPTMNMPVSDPEPRTEPPAWDPLGAAPFAWDLPEPTPVGPEPEPPARRPRTKVGGITLGAALAVGGAAALAMPYASWLTPGHIVGMVLAVIGTGMVLGSLVGGGRGLIGLAVPLALVGFVFANTGPGGPSIVAEQWGDISRRPATTAAVLPDYRVGGGSIDLDLTALPESGIVRTSVSTGLGTVSVLVPPTADVEVNCGANLGSVECLGEEQNASDAHVSTVDYGTDGPGGLKIYLDARVNSGTVEVRRG
jgi:phage shock protein PspC (stress-responsive transcriptional regulator)